MRLKVFLMTCVFGAEVLAGTQLREESQDAERHFSPDNGHLPISNTNIVLDNFPKTPPEIFEEVHPPKHDSALSFVNENTTSNLTTRADPCYSWVIFTKNDHHYSMRFQRFWYAFGTTSESFRRSVIGDLNWARKREPLKAKIKSWDLGITHGCSGWGMDGIFEQVEVFYDVEEMSWFLAFSKAFGNVSRKEAMCAWKHVIAWWQNETQCEMRKKPQPGWELENQPYTPVELLPKTERTLAPRSTRLLGRATAAEEIVTATVSPSHSRAMSTATRAKLIATVTGQ